MRHIQRQREQRKEVATLQRQASKLSRTLLTPFSAPPPLLAAALLAAVGCGAGDSETQSALAPDYLGGAGAGAPTAGSTAMPGGSAADDGAAGAPSAQSDGVDSESMSGIANPSGVASQPGGAGAGAPAGGVQLGMQCVPLCASAATDPDGDGFGFESAVSCVVAGSPAAAGGTPCAPVSMPDAPMLPEGDGFFLGDQCFARCASDATDVDAAGVRDGFGFELGASCVVAGSEPALGAIPCVPEPLDPAAVPAGEGFLLGDQCFPPCIVNAGIDEQGFGFEQARSCILPGSPASTQGIPCIPPPPEVIGICPNPVVCPVVDGRTLPCGCGLIPGFAERKQAIAVAGGDRRFLASAMMETATLTTDYPFGDVAPGPDNRVGTGDDVPKTGGAANFGITKMNWTMIRQCHPAYAGLNDGDFRRGAELNMSLELDIQVYDECRAFFGDLWFGGHRNGVAGLNDPNTADIRAFQGGVEWIFDMLPGHELDDIQFFVSIPAI
jgi:hypothetical protein